MKIELKDHIPITSDHSRKRKNKQKLYIKGLVEFKLNFHL